MAVRPYTTRTEHTSRQAGEVVGLDATTRKLRQLPTTITGRKGGPIKSALMFATLPIFKTIKANILAHPYDIQHMVKDVRRQREKRPDLQGLSEAINIGLKDQNQPGKKLPKWYWPEWGTEHRMRKTGGSTGRMTARPFFRPGFRDNLPTMPARFATKLKKIVDKRVEELARSGGPRRVPR